MIRRALEQKILSLRQKYPILTLTGPRQSGKTTLLKALYPDLPYVSFEDPDIRILATTDPRGILSNYPNGAFFDEVQQVPEIFSYLQRIADEGKAHFVLSGSQNFLLLEQITQSLAGRAAVLTLWPLSLQELSDGNIALAEYEAAVFQGGYPRIFDKDIDPADFYPSYISTYIQRDVRSLRNIENLRQFEIFLQLCAGRIGQVLNIQSLATDAGLSPNTAKAWLSLLEASYVVHFLQPYHQNFSKRLVKSPKLYFCDTGLACSLLGIESQIQYASHFMKGNLFENLVVNEFVKHRLNKGQKSRVYFWQSKTKKEIDLIVEHEGKPLPFEIKSSKTINPHLLSNLHYWQALSGADSEDLKVVYGGTSDIKTSNGTYVSWRSMQKHIPT